MECLRTHNKDGTFAEAILNRILAIPGEKDFAPARRTCDPANLPPGKDVAISNIWTVFTENPIFKPTVHDDPPGDAGDVPHPNVACTRWFNQAPKAVQTVAAEAVSLSRTCLSHCQGVAEAFPPPGTPHKQPARAASAPRPCRQQQQRQQPQASGSGSSSKASSYARCSPGYGCQQERSPRSRPPKEPRRRHKILSTTSCLRYPP